MLWALVPAKLGSTVKTRLGATLTPAQRIDLSHAMLADVLSALGDVPALGGVAVITRDESVATLAERHGASALHETPGGDLNAGVAEGVHACLARGASGILIVMGDLPTLTSAEIEVAIAGIPERGVVLVPSFDGTGTNVLAMRPPDLLLPTRFGADSLARHLAATAERGIETITCPLRSAALDIDTVDDLGRLMRSGASGTATRRLIEGFGHPTVRAQGL